MRRFIPVLLAISILLPALPVSAQQEDTKEAESLFVAQKAFDDGFYDVAFSLLERFIQSYPSSGHIPEARLIIGRCLFQQHRFLEALRQFEDLLNSAGSKKICDAVLYWIAEVHFRGNNFARSASFYKQVVDGYPGSPYASSAYYSLGWCLCQQGRYEEALAAFNALEEKFPGEQQTREAAFKVIECLYNLKDYGRLKERVKDCLRDRKNEPAKVTHLQYYLAESEYYLENYDQAVSAYSMVIQASSDQKMKGLAGLGSAWSHIKLKNYPQARESFASVNPEGLDSQYRDIYYMGKAVLSYETGDFAEAQRLYKKLSAMASDPLLGLQAELGIADSLYGRGEYREAVEAYARLSRKTSGGEYPREITDRLHHSLAWAYLKEGNFKEAIAEFRKIAAQSEDKIYKVSALCQIGDAYQDAGDNARARETYEKILNDFPGGFYADYVQYQLGITLLKIGEYDTAIGTFQKLRKSHPESKLVDDAQYALGLAYFQKKDFAASRDLFRDFSEAFRDSGLRGQARYLHGTSLFNLGEYSRAIEVFKEIVREHSGDKDIVQKAEYEIADCYYQLGDEKEAMSRFNQLRVKYPDSGLSAEIMWWLGEYYYRKDDLELAIRYFSSLIRDFGDSALVPNAHYALGSIYAEEGKFEEALASFRRVPEISSAEIGGQAALAMAEVYARQAKTEEAEKTYQNALAAHPYLAHMVYPKMGELLADQGRYDEALSWYAKSLDLVPLRELAEINFRMAEIHQAQGRPREAIEQYMKIAYLFPGNRELGVKAMLRVARLHEEEGNPQEALALYRKIEGMEVTESKFALERIRAIEGGEK